MRSTQNIPLLPSQINAVLEDTIGNILLDYRHLVKGTNAAFFQQSYVNYFGWLAQEVDTRIPKGTNTILFIPRNIVPKNKQVLYDKPVASIQPNKTEVNWVRLTAGGDKLDYPGVTSADVASLTTTKSYLKSGG